MNAEARKSSPSAHPNKEGDRVVHEIHEMNSSFEVYHEEVLTEAIDDLAGGNRLEERHRSAAV